MENFLYSIKIKFINSKNLLFFNYLLQYHWYIKVVLVHQLDIFLPHVFHHDQHLKFFDLDHKQGDKKKDPKKKLFSFFLNSIKIKPQY